MARKKVPPVEEAPSNRVTNRDLMNAVQGIHGRIDDVNLRVDKVADQVTKMHSCVLDLREATNERLHGFEGDIASLRRPWQLLAGGWRKAIALAGVASALTGAIVRFVGLPF